MIIGGDEIFEFFIKLASILINFWSIPIIKVVSGSTLEVVIGIVVVNFDVWIIHAKEN